MRHRKDDDMTDDISHPGEFIREELQLRGWAQRDLAYVLGVHEQAVSLIMSGKRGISPQMSKGLGEALGVSGDYFANLQTAYELSTATDPVPGIARRARLLFYPIREMIRRGWLEDTDTATLELQLMRFFCVDDIDGLEDAIMAKVYGQKKAKGTDRADKWSAEFTDVPYGPTLSEAWTVDSEGGSICVCDGPDAEENARRIANLQAHRKDDDMTDAKDDGGPAFEMEMPVAYTGMTLRDWFAGQALAGLSSGSHCEPGGYAHDAYSMADAMLAERKIAP